MSEEHIIHDRISDHLDPSVLRRVLGQYPTGVTIVTAIKDGAPIGMTANSFASVSLDPPLVLWSLAKSAPSHDAFIASDSFAIHFLGAAHSELAMTFGRSGQEKFSNISYTPGITGSPLLEGLAPIFECRVWARYPGGDHTILVGEVVQLVERSHDPLVFHSGKLRGIESAQQREATLVDGSFARTYLAYLLARASVIVSGEFHARLNTWELSVPEWRVLACLMDVEGLSVGELAAMALMKQPALTKVLDRMEADGLVQRQYTEADRRRTLIHLTDEGRRRAEPALVAARQHEAELLAGFSDQERATIKYALDLLIDSRIRRDSQPGAGLNI